MMLHNQYVERQKNLTFLDENLKTEARKWLFNGAFFFSLFISPSRSLTLSLRIQRTFVQKTLQPS
jgi:hypothetical protein